MATKTVLLVDYDPKSIALIRRALVSMGVNTILARDGLAAESEFYRVQPDVTLVQEIIPKGRGIDLCRMLKKGRSTGHRAIILLARAREGARARMLAACCDDLIETPLDEATFVAKVRKFLPESTSLPIASL